MLLIVPISTFRSLSRDDPLIVQTRLRGSSRCKHSEIKKIRRISQVESPYLLLGLVSALIDLHEVLSTIVLIVIIGTRSHAWLVWGDRY